LSGLVQLPKKFKIVRRRKTRRYIDDSRDEEQISAVDNQIIEPISLESAVPVVHVAVPIAESIADLLLKLHQKNGVVNLKYRVKSYKKIVKWGDHRSREMLYRFLHEEVLALKNKYTFLYI
jgi:hypothetical protein